MSSASKQAAAAIAKSVKGKTVGKKKSQKELPDPFLKVTIKARMATAAPPLGPALGSRGVNVAAFCKDFNEKTRRFALGTPLPVEVTVTPDRKYDLKIFTPPSSYLLKIAAGIRRTKHKRGEITGMLSVKHIYEIAKFKEKDVELDGVPLQDICQRLVNTCNILGIKVQNEDLEPDELRKFLEERKQVVAKQIKEEQELEAQKVLRT
ncbi:ribosomal protein l11, RNA binding domain-containing protein [Ditylenchus destructor]|nr:ribosomal protein l11, RNA binding domain-containing protein [Ditylenchus destructor]